MILKDTPKIICPMCGQEYLPSEIFIPESFFGKPSEIIRDPAGKIEFFVGEDMCLEETYFCDNCNKEMKIRANINFEVNFDSEDFEEEYIRTFEKPKKITLEEEELF